MNSFGIAFVVLDVTMLQVLPRRWAPFALLLGACYINRAQAIDLGPFTFTALRILVGAGIVRVLIRREYLSDGFNSLDKLMFAWSSWAVLSCVFHADVVSALINRLGLVYDALGMYYLLRCYCRSFEDIAWLCRLTGLLIIPIAVEMIFEKLMVYNVFAALAGLDASPAIRDGKIRARGPFDHAILAGTIGAVSLPLVVALWQRNRKVARLGVGSCVVMVAVAASSGPVMSAMAAVGSLLLWHYRQKMRAIRWLAIGGYLVLDLVMKDPAYFIMARIDLTGSSTGWHRARLIQSAYEHLSEWWLGGTDYTRHWMATGVSWSENHTDITNHYLHMGVVGGLPLMVLFIYILARGFSYVGQALRQATEKPSIVPEFMVWALGASLFTHSVTFISVSYYDQSFVFIYLSLALISALVESCHHLGPSKVCKG